MKQTIRLNTFETNSSTTHAMVICEGEEQEKLWEDGKLFVDWCGTISNLAEVKAEFEKEKEEFTKSYYESEGYDEDDDVPYDEIFEAWLYENEYYTSNTWHEELEGQKNTYTTKSGDKLYIHCRYGRDG